MNAAALVWSKRPGDRRTCDTGPLIPVTERVLAGVIPCPGRGESMKGGRITLPNGERSYARGCGCGSSIAAGDPACWWPKGRLNSKGRAVASVECRSGLTDGAVFLAGAGSSCASGWTWRGMPRAIDAVPGRIVAGGSKASR